MKGLFRPLYNVFTAGETIASLEASIRSLRNQQLYPIADYIKEYATTKDDVSRTLNEYKKLAYVPGLDYIALKPSSFMFQPEPMCSLIQHLIIHKKKVLIDAEDVVHQKQINSMTDMCIHNYNIDGVWVYKTYQMYRRDSLQALMTDCELFPYHGVKLVRGAYWKKDRHTGELYTSKAETDKAFRTALQYAIHRTDQSAVHTMVCTHNTQDIDYMIHHNKHDGTLMHASLQGFIPNDTKNIVDARIPAYKYLPYGAMEDAVPYLLRRIQENPYILKYYFA